MGAQRWCILGVTVLLLACEVAVSQLCHSLILLMDSFHTFYILMFLVHQALTHRHGHAAPPPASPAPPPQAPPSSAPAPVGPPAISPAEPLAGTASGDPGPAETPPPPLGCGLSYSGCRIQVVGGFLAALFLASLCVSGLLEIIGLFLGPKPVRHHLLLAAVSGGSLFHKMLVLWWSWEREQTPKGQADGQTDSAKEDQRNFAQDQLAANDAPHNGALVLCNPGASGITDTDPENPTSHAGENQDGKAPEESRESEAGSSGGRASPSTSQPGNSLHPPDGASPDRQWPQYLLSLALILQTLGSALLALAHSLVMLTVGTKCQHSSGACAFLLLQDPTLSLLAVIMLTAVAMLQVRRYGLLLLQATPPCVCVSDLGQRIRSVPGVQAVHDLHIWQLSESVMVASVHVHCHAEFAAHRCADLMSGVTKVLQSVGVNCCTIQPEFAACSGSPSCQSSAVADVEDLKQSCHLACSKTCAGFMCCSSLQEETQTLSPPPAQDAMEEPQTLIMANNFTEGN
ncbi:uncharacterized protein LOC142895020 [Nelusetta ayraudi]|uniref:uncharacterized protein LOC142895020 n=1 Tax=Nelusetta ayraudi TaxID=303726 RepID=UPI003F711063